MSSHRHKHQVMSIAKSTIFLVYFLDDVVFICFIRAKPEGGRAGGCFHEASN